MKYIAYSVIIILLGSSSLWAGDIDLSIKVNPSSPVMVEPGEYIAQFSITVSNHGPDTAGIDSTFSHPVAMATEEIYLEENGYPVDFIINNNINQDCKFETFSPDPAPGNPTLIILAFRTPIIPAGESITCYGYHYTNILSGSRSIEWRPLSVTDTEINPSNDIETMVFQVQVPMVPSSSIYSLIFLTFIMMVFAYRFKTTP